LSETAATEKAEFSGRFRGVFSYTDEQVMNAVAYMLSESGCEVASVEMTNLEGQELVLKVLDSPFAGVYGPSIQPACHTLLGMFRGVAMTLFESESSGMEVRCEAKGDTCCRFVVRARLRRPKFGLGGSARHAPSPRQVVTWTLDPSRKMATPRARAQASQ
jgi:predicted hydrocarbon binding protein